VKCSCTGKVISTLTFCLLSLVVTGLVVFLFIWFRGIEVWGEHGGLIPERKPCENNTIGFLRQPVGAFTSLFYFYVGFYVLCCAIFDYHAKRNGELLYSPVVDHQEAEILLDQLPTGDSDSDEMTEHAQHRMLQEIEDLEKNHSTALQNPFTSFIYGLMVFFLGVSSLLYHACDCSVGDRMKVAALIGCAVMPILYQFVLLGPKCCGMCSSHYFFLPLVIIITGISASLPEALKLFPGIEWKYLYVGLLFIIILDCLMFLVTVIRLTKTHVIHKKHLLLSILFLSVSIGLWLPEGYFEKCLIPAESPVKPLHGLTHIFSAAALFCFYCFFRSISFLNSADAILWRPAVLLKHKSDKKKTKDDFEGSMKFDL